MMYEDSDNEEGYHDEDDDLEEIRGEAERNRRNVQQPIRNQVPPMRAAPPQVIPQAGWGLGRAAIQHMLGNFASGGGHPFARPSASLFRSDYKAWSTSIHEAGQGRLERIDGGRQNLMFGGNILMPADALEALTRMDIEPPWTFELINPRERNKRTHGGVLEFTAPSGIVYLPQWMMNHLGLGEGDPLRINGAALPKGKFVKLQPQELTFLELSDPKAVLERALPNFPCVTVGDIIEISHQLIHLRFLIMEVKAREGESLTTDAINILNTDIEVDFAPPVGYVEPERKAREPAPTMASKLGINVEATDEKKDTNKFDAFVGVGNSLGGKRIKGKGTKAKKIEEVDAESKIRRTDRQTVINANEMNGDRQVPAALNLPFGHLFFGYQLVPLRQGGTADLAKAEGPLPAPSFTGRGATLSGRTRPNQAQHAQSSNAASKSDPTISTEQDPAKIVEAFSGRGNSLIGSKPSKPKRDVIEID